MYYGNRSGIAGGISSVWRTVYEVDLTALATSSAAGNGNFTVDGKTWTIENFAGVDSLGLLNGTGLRFDCNASNTNYDGSTRSAPLIKVPVLTLAPAFKLWVTPVRVSVIVSSNADQNYEFLNLSIEDADSPSSMAYIAQKGFNGAQVLGAKYIKNSVSGGFIDSNTTSHDCLQLTLARLGCVEAAFATSVGGLLPDQSTFYARGTYNDSSTSAMMAMHNEAKVNVALSAHPTNTSNNFVGAFKRLRVELLA